MKVDLMRLTRMLTIAFVPALALMVDGSATPTHAEPGSHVHDAPPATGKTWRETAEDVWNRDTLTGDWRGLRTDLAKYGVYPQVRFTQVVQDVASGGAKSDAAYGGMVDWRLNVDASTLAGLPWKGLVVSLHAQTRYGKDVTADAGDFVLPNVPLLFPLPGDYSGTDVTGLMVEQALFDGKVDVFFGKLNVLDLWTGFYPNVAYGQEGFLNLNALALRAIRQSDAGPPAGPEREQGRRLGGHPRGAART